MLSSALLSTTPSCAADRVTASPYSQQLLAQLLVKCLRSSNRFFVDRTHREAGLAALARLRDNVQQELVRQGSVCDVSLWESLTLRTPKQPDSVGCGVCVLISIELMATEGVGAFYLLNVQCNNWRPGGPRPKGAAKVPEENCVVDGALHQH